MLYAGIDYHKKYSQVEVIKSSGEVIWAGKVPTSKEGMMWWINKIYPHGTEEGKRDKIKTVIEASWGWERIYDLLENIEEIEEIKVAHCLKLRWIAESRIKTDKIDADKLAKLLKAGLIPEIYVPDRKDRERKEMIRYRLGLVRMRTIIKNKVHALLDKVGVSLPKVSDLFGKRGKKFLRELKIEGAYGKILCNYLDLIEGLDKKIKKAEEEVRELMKGNKEREIIKSVPGFGDITSAIVTLEIGNIERFSSPKKLISYAGLSPSTYSSGGRTYHGALIKQSNKWLRWAVIEASWVAQRESLWCRTYFASQVHKGKNVAIVGLGRKLLKIIWYLLKEKREYEERPVEKEKFDFPVALSNV